ncbi:hypothetical protein RJ639_028598 [Escallonia herrerae]|uniref:MaoC-like domain-containing protein n=1 Tax=Escallonia herrerae TaxID=1293975 RepID=A0AA88X3E3_9ASTE|nr:hypothetical protein RJ639_028598 [Escallonia herrerae]
MDFRRHSRITKVYALGVGACARGAVDKNELKYVYHQDGQQFIQVLPTFASLLALEYSSHLADLPGLSYDPRLLLHGQQYIEIYRPLPSSCCVRFLITSSECKAAVVDYEVVSYEKESGKPLCMNRMSVYLRGAGGFSKSSQPISYAKYPANQILASKVPNRQPFTALLYRLSGDYNPLHSDPTIAEVAGFSRPILHGLCTLGFAIRAIIKCICGGDPNLIKAISGRFLLHFYPGETLITEMWLEGLRVLYQVKVKERNRTVLSGFVDISRLSSAL